MDQTPIGLASATTTALARIPRTISKATKNVVNVLNIAGGDNSESPKETLDFL
jgi:hypothetical protein